MATRTKTSAVFAKTLLLLFALSLVGIFLMKPPLTSSIARVQGERVFESALPKDIPVKLKVKTGKERSFKDLKNERWVRDFELELTNTGDKPIYFLYLTLVTDVRVDGQRLVFPLVYGRLELGDIISKALPADTAIKPGEVHLFKIHPGQIGPWEKAVRNRDNPEATRLRAELQSLSFGDGTGYFGNQPYPPGADINRSPPPPEATTSDTGPPRLGVKVEDNVQLKTSSIVDLPVSFLPALFLTSESSNAANLSVKALSVSACQFEECVGIVPGPPIHVCHNCPPQNRPTFFSAGVCRELSYDKIRCELGGDEWFWCQTIDIYDCGFGPGPTPVPTPTPTPAPCEYCPPNQSDPTFVGPRIALLRLSQLAH